MKKILITLFITLLISSCWEENVDNTKYYETSNVITWSLDNTTSYVWYIKWVNDVALSFKSPWKVDNIYYDVWDVVEEGQLLAELDWSEAKTWYSSSSNIINSLTNLRESTSLSYDKQIESVEAQIQQLEKSLELSQISIDWAQSWVNDTNNITSSQINTVKNQISQAELWLETSELNYQNTKQTLEQKEEDIYTNSKNSITSANTLWNSMFDYLDNIFWVTDENKNKNDSYEIYLGAKNSSQKSKTENLIESWILKFKWLNDSYSNLTTRDEIKIALNEYYDFFNNDVKDILSSSYKTLENSINSNTLTQEQINEFKRTISDFQSKNESVILTVSWNYMIWLKWSLDSIESIAKEKKSTLDMLQKQIENNKKQIEILNQTLETYESQSSWSINEAQTWLKQAQKQKEIVQSQILEAKSWLEALIQKKNSSINEINTQISQARASQNDAWVMIQNTKIYAPFSGVISNKVAIEWQVVWAWTPILYLSDSSDVKAVVNVWENIIDSLSLWDSVNVKVDWLSDIFTFEVSKIYPTKDEITKKTSVEVSYNNDLKDIKVWSYSKVYFDVSNKDKQWLLIPNESIVSKYMLPWVYLLDSDWVARFKKIEILNQNDDFSQITWLSLWDTVITYWKSNVYDWEILINKK